MFGIKNSIDLDAESWNGFNDFELNQLHDQIGIFEPIYIIDMCFSLDIKPHSIDTNPVISQDQHIMLKFSC